MPVISYSCRDSDHSTIDRIVDLLISHFGKEMIRNLEAVQPFGDPLVHANFTLGWTDVVLVFVGSTFLGIAKDGRNQIREKTDPVRVAIETAMQFHLPIIPVLIGNTTMPNSDQLPPGLRDFSFYSAVKVDADQDFNLHVDHLIQSIDAILSQIVRPSLGSGEESQTGSRKFIRGARRPKGARFEGISIQSPNAAPPTGAWTDKPVPRLLPDPSMSPSLSSGEKVQASASRESIPPQLPTTALPITALMQKRRELRPFLDIEGLNIKEQDTNDEPIAKRYLNELGTSELPVNWRVLNFEKFCDIEGGNQPPKSQFVDEPRDGYVQLFQIRDLGERGVPTYIPIKSARSLSKEGDILIGRYGASVGKVFWSQNGAYNVAMAKFIWPHDAFISKFAFLLLKSDFLQGPLANATRSAQAGFNKGDLAAINFPLPPSPNNNASSLNTTS